MTPKTTYHIHISIATPDDGRELVRQLAEDSKLIAIDRVVTTKSGRQYKVTRVEFGSPSRGYFSARHRDPQTH